MIYPDRKQIKENIDSLRKIRDVQGADGNWNYDPYMHGMYNGTEASLAILEGREPIYKKDPTEWLSDKEDKRTAKVYEHTEFNLG